MADISEATRDNVVRRALERSDWFKAADLKAVASTRCVSRILNDLVKEGQLEKRRTGHHNGAGGSVVYMWTE